MPLTQTTSMLLYNPGRKTQNKVKTNSTNSTNTCIISTHQYGNVNIAPNFINK